MQNAKPIHRAERTNDSVFSITSQYQQEYRGIVEYYRLAYNLSTQLNRLKWIMEGSLTKTLAHKLKISVRKVYKRFQTQIQKESGSYKVLRVEVPREGKKPLVAQWGGIPLTWRKDAVLDDDPPCVWNNQRTELEERLLADRCELCGSNENVSTHHERALKDLRRGKSEWVKTMAARQRKTLVVCQKHHEEIHSGRYDGNPAKNGKRALRAG